MKHSNSNWNLYRCFLVVYETKNLHSAAEMLGLSRSTVGSNIQALGDQIGAKLFTSNRKGMEPTSEAVTLYPSIKKAVDLIIESEENIQEFRHDTRAVIRLAVPATFANQHLHNYLKSFCENYPNIRFEFFGRNSFELLAQKKIDFVIDADYSFKTYDFKLKHICIQTGVFVASKEFLNKHGLSDTISKEVLLSLPVIAHREFWTQLGLHTDLVISTASTELSFSMAKNGLGIAYYFKEYFDDSNNDGMVRLNVEGVDLPVTNLVCGYNNHHLTKPAKAFLDGFVEFLSS